LVLPGIRRAIECLETDFANDLSIAELADQAQLSRSHFALTFQSALSAHRTKITKIAKASYLYEQNRARRLCAAAQSVAYLPRLRAGFRKDN
jgi:transcriptional regulator GlxA family with amidase domain